MVNKRIAVTPIHLDLTGRRLLRRLKTWAWELPEPEVDPSSRSTGAHWASAGAGQAGRCGRPDDLMGSLGGMRRGGKVADPTRRMSMPVHDRRPRPRRAGVTAAWTALNIAALCGHDPAEPIVGTTMGNLAGAIAPHPDGFDWDRVDRLREGPRS